MLSRVYVSEIVVTHYIFWCRQIYRRARLAGWSQVISIEYDMIPFEEEPKQIVKFYFPSTSSSESKFMLPKHWVIGNHMTDADGDESIDSERGKGVCEEFW